MLGGHVPRSGCDPALWWTQTGLEAIEAVDNFFRNTWNAQRAQVAARVQLEAVPPQAPLSVALPQQGMLRPLMVPGTIAAQNQLGLTDLQLPGSPIMMVGYGAPAALQPAVDSNGGEAGSPERLCIVASLSHCCLPRGISWIKKGLLVLL